MSVSGGSIGKGATLSYSSNGGSTYTAIAELIENIGIPTVEVRAEEFTEYSSPAGAEEYKPGWFFLGDGNFKVNYVGAGAYAALMTIMQAGTILMWKLIMPITGTQTTAGDTHVWSGFMTKQGPQVPIKNRMTGEFSIKGSSGVVTVTNGS